MKWIDVYDRLPGLGVTCLFVINGHVDVGELGSSDSGYRLYTGKEFEETSHISKITCWAYLPRPPKLRTKKEET